MSSATKFPTKGLNSERRSFTCIFHADS
jgi:hypothetical protein